MQESPPAKLTQQDVIRLILKAEPGPGPEMTVETTTEGNVDTITVKVPMVFASDALHPGLRRSLIDSAKEARAAGLHRQVREQFTWHFVGFAQVRGSLLPGAQRAAAAPWTDAERAAADAAIDAALADLRADAAALEAAGVADPWAGLRDRCRAHAAELDALAARVGAAFGPGLSGDQAGHVAHRIACLMREGRGMLSAAAVAAEEFGLAPTV